MTTVDYRSAAPADPAAERTERARRAVAAFRRMQPMLNNYARTFTGNPRVSVEVHASSNGATDGRKIYFRPPISLGDDHKHTRKLCDKRDPETLAQLCRACELREQVLVVIYHEIAHICYGTFAQPSEVAQADLLRRAVEASETKYAAAITERIQKLQHHVKHSYLAMAGQVSPFLPIILNAVEDARVNNNLFNARRGTRLMFKSDTLRTFMQGVETLDADGTPRYMPWNGREQNLQLIVGLYCAVSEYDYSDWFIPPVVDALNDKLVQELCIQARTTKNVDDNYQLSFKFLERFRQLGFCKSDTDPEDTNEPEPDNENTDGDEDDEGDKSSSDSEPDGDDLQSEEDNEEPETPGEPDSGDLDEDSDDDSSSDEVEDGDPEATSDESDPEETDESEAEGDGKPTDQPSEDEVEDQFGESDEGTAESDEAGQEETESEEEGGSEDGGEQGTGDIGRQDNESGTPEAEADDSGEDDEGAPPAVAGEEDGSPDNDPGADDEGMGNSSDSSDDTEFDESVDDSDEEPPADADPGARTDSRLDDGDESTSSNGDFEDGELTDELGNDEANKFEFDPEAEHDASIDPESETTVDMPEEPDEQLAGEDDETIDTGADEGMGGIEVEEVEYDYDSVPMGDPAEVKEGLDQFGHHEEKEQTEQDRADDEALLTAIMQGLYFETPSVTISGVRIHEFGKPIVNDLGENMSTAWGGKVYATSYTRRELGIDGDFKPEESIIGRQLLKLRVVFADNQRSHNQNHLKSGRVNTRVLGRRAPLQDERLFRKKLIPGKKSYFVAIALDISGSTVGRNLQLIKAAGWAQADLLTRLGIPFAMYGCSGYYDSEVQARQMFLDIYPVKHENEPWNKATQERIQELGPDGGNLDGHNLEFMRKLCDKSQATDKIIMYYSDGKMPATNYSEELEILVRELAICKKKGYTVAGVGVRTDSPSRHGLPTVQINDKNDIGKVVSHLEAMLRTKL